MKTYGKLLLTIGMCFTLGCSHSKEPSSTVETPTPAPTETPEPTPTPKPTHQTTSLSPNEVTDYDKEAITSLIVKDLKLVYGSDYLDKLDSNGILFSKTDGKISATGAYYYKENRKTMSKDFSYIYEDKNVNYELVERNIGLEEQPQATTAPSSTPAILDEEPDKTYDVNIRNSITVTASCSTEGTIVVKIVDSDGKEVAEVLNATGPTETSNTVEVDAGEYEMQVYVDGGWSYSYSYN